MTVVNLAVCPTCGTPISQIKRNEIVQNEKTRLAELKASVTKDVEVAYQQRLKKEKDNVEKMAQEWAKKEIATAVADRDRLTNQVKLLQTREAAVKKQAELDAQRKIKLIEADANRRLRKDLKEQRDALDKERDRVTLRLSAEFNREREAYKKKLQEMERRVQRQTANQLGEGAEIDIFETLRQSFPNDRIDRIPKAATGADIVQEVMWRDKTCGKILIDSKNRQAWKKEYVAKLRQDKESGGAEHAILSTAAFPAGKKEFCVEDGIILTSPVHLAHVVGLLREFMIKLHQARLSEQDRATKMNDLYSYINSDAFKEDIQAAAKLTKEILDLDVVEQAQHQRVWRERGLLATRLGKMIQRIDTNILVILEEPKRGSLRPVA